MKKRRQIEYCWVQTESSNRAFWFMYRILCLLMHAITYSRNWTAIRFQNEQMPFANRKRGNSFTKKGHLFFKKGHSFFKKGHLFFNFVCTKSTKWTPSVISQWQLEYWKSRGMAVCSKTLKSIFQLFWWKLDGNRFSRRSWVRIPVGANFFLPFSLLSYLYARCPGNNREEIENPKCQNSFWNEKNENEK